MKAKELAEELMKYPDYEVDATVLVEDPSENGWGWYGVTGIVSGIDYVNRKTKTIILDAED